MDGTSKSEKLNDRVQEYCKRGYRIRRSTPDQVVMVKSGFSSLPLVGRWVGQRYRVRIIQDRSRVLVEFC